MSIVACVCILALDSRQKALKDDLTQLKQELQTTQQEVQRLRTAGRQFDLEKDKDCAVVQNLVSRL